MSKTGENTTSITANDSALLNGSHVDKETPQRSDTDRVRNEVDKIVATVETRIHDAVLAAMESVVIPIVERVKKSVSLCNSLSLSIPFCRRCRG